MSWYLSSLNFYQSETLKVSFDKIGTLFQELTCANELLPNHNKLEIFLFISLITYGVLYDFDQLSGSFYLCGESWWDHAGILKVGDHKEPWLKNFRGNFFGYFQNGLLVEHEFLKLVELFWVRKIQDCHDLFVCLRLFLWRQI